MEIQQLELENIGCYPAQVFDFSNLTVIYGENRTGKSTLVYALYFSLFGKHLHKALNISDLCRKGEAFGTATIHFKESESRYKLRRATVGIPSLSQWQPDVSAWQPIADERPNQAQIPIPINAEVASLTSFFREGELIYFLQEIPKYNKTLLQNLMKMDDILIVQSRFKKALGIATEEKKALHKAVPKHIVNPTTLQEAQKLVEHLQKKRLQMDEEYKSLAQYQNKAIDPNVFKLLQQQYDEKHKALEIAQKLRNKISLTDELEKSKNELKKYLVEHHISESRQNELQRQLGQFDLKIQNLQTDIQRLAHLEKQPNCYTCGQPIPKEKLSLLISQLRVDETKVKAEKKAAEDELQKIHTADQAYHAHETDFKKTIQEIDEAHRLDQYIIEMKTQSDKAYQNLERLKQIHSDSKDAEKYYQRLQQIEKKRTQLEKLIIDNKVRVKQLEEDFKNFNKSGQKLQAADKNILVCKIAYQAINDAFQRLNRDILEQVRKSITEWIAHFSFLQQFDIQLTANQLSPIIQAKGYQYKLNQMSKSERIFLYLMLKLAIGDALSHLGVFVLDDPTDGLDQKRKEMMAQILAKIAQKRQIIITTNDAIFADMFPDVHRINLS